MFSISVRKRRKTWDAARTLYGHAVKQSRRPEFYTNLGVPDTLDGRFDMVALHVFLLLHRLRCEGAVTRRLAQCLFDTMFNDMDYNLRELGVGDLGVGRRVKSMAKALYGRIAAYEAGLAADDEALAAALARNLFRNREVLPPQLGAFCLYLRREAAGLAREPYEALAAGRVEFGSPPAPSAEAVSPAMATRQSIAEVPLTP